MMDKTDLIIREVLEKRGILSEKDILEFLSVKPQKTYDPFLLLNLEAGVDLILSTIHKGKKICIYGDYDADGITSISILFEILSHLTENLTYYIPSRFDEGYGLNMDAIRKIKEDGTSLIVTVDCGSVSYDEVELARELGLEIIITDHHNINKKIPECLVINPKQADCTYPFKELAGCGVAFKLAQGIREKTGLPKSVVLDLLDLVGIGTIGDIVPLIDENRTLVKYGMKAINQTKRQGLIKLIRETGLPYGEVNSENVAYVIVPHINSAGRISKPEIAVELLLSKEERIQTWAVESLILSNKERRKLQEEAFLQCSSIVEEFHLNDNFKVVLAENIHEGIAGIVAGKLKDKYERPVIIMTNSGECFKGTGRSIKNIDLYKTLKGVEDIFEKFGGHFSACGFLMKKENIFKLREYLVKEVNRQFSENAFLYDVASEPDGQLTGGEISKSLIHGLEKLAPFGHSNEKPFFQIDHVRINNLNYMGIQNKHLRFNSTCADGTVLPCILFNNADKFSNCLKNDIPVSIYGFPSVNSWNGSEKIQFVVSRIKC